MPAITGVAHVELSVRDLDVSSRWYCRLLGAREVFRQPNEAEALVACAILEPRSGTVLAFTKHHHPTAGAFDVRRVGLDHVAFGVADLAGLEAWRATLDDLGIPNSGIQDIGYAKSITFRDPDGSRWRCFCRRGPADRAGAGRPADQPVSLDQPRARWARRKAGSRSTPSPGRAATWSWSPRRSSGRSRQRSYQGTFPTWCSNR